MNIYIFFLKNPRPNPGSEKGTPPIPICCYCLLKHVAVFVTPLLLSCFLPPYPFPSGLCLPFLDAPRCLNRLLVPPSYGVCDAANLSLSEAYWDQEPAGSPLENLVTASVAAAAAGVMEQNLPGAQGSVPLHPHINGHGVGAPEHP